MELTAFLELTSNLMLILRLTKGHVELVGKKLKR